VTLPVFKTGDWHLRCQWCVRLAHASAKSCDLQGRIGLALDCCRHLPVLKAILMNEKSDRSEMIKGLLDHWPLVRQIRTGADGTCARIASSSTTVFFCRGCEQRGPAISALSSGRNVRLKGKC